MKMVLVGDDESSIMFHLLGIDSIIAESEPTSFRNQFESLLKEPDIGIIVITESVLIRNRDYILPIKMQRRSPIIVEIPSMIDTFHEDYVSEVIKKYIGIDVSNKSK